MGVQQDSKAKQGKLTASLAEEEGMEGTCEDTLFKQTKTCFHAEGNGIVTQTTKQSCSILSSSC